MPTRIASPFSCCVQTHDQNRRDVLESLAQHHVSADSADATAMIDSMFGSLVVKIRQLDSGTLEANQGVSRRRNVPNVGF